jgi:hypothetical protein
MSRHGSDWKLRWSIQQVRISVICIMCARRGKRTSYTNIQHLLRHLLRAHTFGNQVPSDTGEHRPALEGAREDMHRHWPTWVMGIDFIEGRENGVCMFRTWLMRLEAGGWGFGRWVVGGWWCSGG